MKAIMALCVGAVLACSGISEASDIKSDMIERCSDGKEHLVVYVPDGEVVDLTEGDTLRIVEWDTERFEALSKENEVLIVARCHVEDHRYSAFPRPRLDTPSSEIKAMLEMEYRFKTARRESALSSELFHILVDVESDTLVEYGPGVYIREKLDAYFAGVSEEVDDYAPLYITLGGQIQRFTLFPKAYSRIVDMMDVVYGAYFLKYVRNACREEVRTMDDLLSCEEIDVYHYAYLSVWYGGDFFRLVPYTGEVPTRFQLF